MKIKITVFFYSVTGSELRCLDLVSWNWSKQSTFSQILAFYELYVIFWKPQLTLFTNIHRAFLNRWLHRNQRGGYWSTFFPNPQKMFISAKFVKLSGHIVLFVTRMMLLLYSSFLSFSAKLAMSSYLLQGHEGRSVQFATCVKVNIPYESFKLYRPAFMTLELIDDIASFAEKLRNDEYVLVLKSKHWFFLLEFVKSVEWFTHRGPQNHFLIPWI